MNGVAAIGAGRIGVPWAVVLAAELDIEVTCIDIDEDRVEALNHGEAPFNEPQLSEYLSRAVTSGNFKATTDSTAIRDHRYVAFTINAKRNEMAEFLDVVKEYASLLTSDQIIINRSTLPIDIIDRMQKTIEQYTDGSPTFIVFPERLAEGTAIKEIESLPKIVGVDSRKGREAMLKLLDGLDCDIRFTDTKTAMFVKLIDNSYRDALFAIANQIAYTADELGLNAHKAIALANYEYPRNDIPSPGLVGGKCLPKDPHFLTDERVCDQPTTPDLFSATRRTNARLPSYIVTEILRRRPTEVAMLGLSYKQGVGDTHNSPAKAVAEELESQGVLISGYDPYVPSYDELQRTLNGVDTVVLAINHEEFKGIEAMINEQTADEAFVYDVWGILNRNKLDRTYGGLGITEAPFSEPENESN